VLDLRRAVFDRIEASLAPLPVDVVRFSTINTDRAWLRPPSVAPGRVRALPRFMTGALILDIWRLGSNQKKLDDDYQKLGWMHGYSPPSVGSAMALRYTETSWVVVPEPSAVHGTVTWEVEYFDRRGL
jgi:hypothetical protein